MKRIKIITYDNFPFGGAPANLLRLFSLSLSIMDSEIEVIIPTGNVYRNKVELKPKRKGCIEKVKYIHLGFKEHPMNYIGKVLDIFFGLILTPIYLFISNISNSFDTIVSYNTHVTRIIHLIIFKFIFKKKLLLILPEFYEKPQKSILAILHWYDFYIGLRFLAKYADGFITVSNFLSKYIKDDLKVDKPLYVMPNLTDPEVFLVKKETKFKPNKITIGYTGTPTRKDGVVDLIKSFALVNKAIKNTHLLIVGDVINGSSVIPDLRKLSIELGCSESVSFTGLVPFNKIPELLNSCQILALTRPSGIFAEAGFPTKLGEYFACKKPILVTNVGDISYYFKNEEHVIIVAPDNIDSMVDGFTKIIKDNYLREKIAENGFNWMNNNLNYRNVSHKLYSFINNI